MVSNSSVLSVRAMSMSWRKWRALINSNFDDRNLDPVWVLLRLKAYGFWRGEKMLLSDFHCPLYLTEYHHRDWYEGAKQSKSKKKKKIFFCFVRLVWNQQCGESSLFHSCCWSKGLTFQMVLLAIIFIQGKLFLLLPPTTTLLFFFFAIVVGEIAEGIHNPSACFRVSARSILMRSREKERGKNHTRETFTEKEEALMPIRALLVEEKLSHTTMS